MMRQDLQDLIDTCNKLCNRLDEMAAEEVRFGYEMQSELERLSWEIMKNSEDLKSIKEWVG